MQDPIEVHTPAGSFILWRSIDCVHCKMLLPEGGARDIGYLHEIPSEALPQVLEAAERLRAEPSYPTILNRNPWESGAHRISSLASCIECPQLGT